MRLQVEEQQGRHGGHARQDGQRGLAMEERDKEKELAQIRSKLKELLVRDLSLQNVTAEDIKDDAPLFGDGLGLDSLDAVEIAAMLDRHFGVSVRGMDVGRKIFQSVNTLADFVYENKGTPKPPPASPTPGTPPAPASPRAAQ